MGLTKIFNNIIGSRTAGRLNTGTYGNTALASLLTVNNLIDQLNATVFNNRPLSFVYNITETPGVVGLGLRLMKVSSGCDCCGCTDASIDSKCDGVSYKRCANPEFALDRSAPGVYTGTINLPSDIIPNEVVVTFGNVAQLGVIINVTKVSNTEYQITAYDTQTGSPVNDVLTDVSVEVRLWI
jgi:hypothetical protein